MKNIKLFLLKRAIWALRLRIPPTEEASLYPAWAVKEISIVVILLFVITGCSSAAVNINAGNDGKLNIITTIFPIYDFARIVTDDSADVTLLIQPGMSIHSYDPSVADIQAINQCDVFIYIGGKSDAWVERLLSADDFKTPIDGTPPKILRLMDYVEPVEIENHDGEYDEHIWTSPANAVIIVKAISEFLGFPENTDYINELNQLSEDIKQIVSDSKHDKIVVADRFSMRYFTDYFGLEYEAALGACIDHGDISASSIVRLANTVRDEGINYIYYSELTDRFAGMNAAQLVAEETNAEMLKLHSVQNVTRSEFDNGATYLTLMRKNAENLRKWLS